jgi:endonuclease YncB( thermonuclease family)
VLVNRAIDGETVQISLGTAQAIVQLLGVDAPEEYWVDRALHYTRARCEGRTVTLRLEPTRSRDPDGRLLAYVYLSDSDLLNLDVIHDGQGFADRRIRHTLRPQFELAENETRRKKRGMWKEMTEDRMPAWRREWLQKLGAGR